MRQINLKENADSVPTNVPTEVTSTGSKNFHNEKVIHKMDCFILHTVLLLLLNVTILNRYLLLSLCKTYVKTKTYWPFNNIKNGE